MKESNLVFEWDDSSANIGHYACVLYEVENGKKKELDEISFTDHTNKWQKQDAEKYQYERAYAFEVSYCNGWSMHKGFGYDKNYCKHTDKQGKRLYGYRKRCSLTVEDVKRWCEEWLAQGYIEAYEKARKTISKKKRRAKSLEAQGYGKMNLEEEKWK